MYSQNTKNFITWQSTLNALTKIALFLTISTIIVILIRKGYGIYGINAIIFTEFDGIECKTSLDRNNVLFWNSFSSDPYSTALNLILLLIGFILFYVTNKFRYFRILRHSVHYSVLEREFKENFIIISFFIINCCSFRPYVKEIIIQYPIDNLKPAEESGDLKVLTNSKIWQIYKKDENVMFRTLNPIKICIDSGNDNYVRNLFVEFGLKDLRWLERSIPEDMVHALSRIIEIEATLTAAFEIIYSVFIPYFLYSA